MSIETIIEPTTPNQDTDAMMTPAPDKGTAIDITLETVVNDSTNTNTTMDNKVATVMETENTVNATATATTTTMEQEITNVTTADSPPTNTTTGSTTTTARKNPAEKTTPIVQNNPREVTEAFAAQQRLIAASKVNRFEPARTYLFGVEAIISVPANQSSVKMMASQTKVLRILQR